MAWIPSDNDHVLSVASVTPVACLFLPLPFPLHPPPVPPMHPPPPPPTPPSAVTKDNSQLAADVLRPVKLSPQGERSEVSQHNSCSPDPHTGQSASDLSLCSHGCVLVFTWLCPCVHMAVSLSVCVKSLWQFVTNIRVCFFQTSVAACVGHQCQFDSNVSGSLS